MTATLHCSGTSIARFPAGAWLLRRPLRDQGQELVAGVAHDIQVCEDACVGVCMDVCMFVCICAFAGAP